MSFANYLAKPNTAAERGAFSIVVKVLRNLATKDVENSESKFRRLRTTNKTISAQLMPISSAVEFLKKVGFSAEEGAEFLVFNGPIQSEKILAEVAALEKILQPLSAVVNSVSDSSNSGSRSIKAQMRAKEEAKRKMLAEKERKERKALLKKFAADKRARKDPNWKAKVSSANLGAQPHAQASVHTNAN